MESMPELAKAAGEGTIGYEAARLVSTVATPETAKAWVDRATRRTLKMLREEIDAAGMLARWRDAPQTPPSDDMVKRIQETESRVMSGTAFIQGIEAGAYEWGVPPMARGQKRAGCVTLKVRVREDTARMYRWLESNYLRFRTDERSFIAFLCLSMIETWKHVLRPTVKWGDVYVRDLFRCRCPVCTSTNLTPHHLDFRSHGGLDDLENLVSVCLWCHLRGIHEGRLRAKPPAEAITWHIGRKPHTVVVGRERLRVA